MFFCVYVVALLMLSLLSLSSLLLSSLLFSFFVIVASAVVVFVIIIFVVVGSYPNYGFLCVKNPSNQTLIGAIFVCVQKADEHCLD